MSAKPNSEQILSRLRTVNDANGGLSDQAIQGVTSEFDVPAHRVEGMATFYSLFDKTDEKSGSRKTVRVCDGLTCWMNGASKIRQELNMRYSDDEAIRLNRTSCIGLCDRAPAALVGMDAIPITAGQSPFDVLPADAPRYTEPRQGETRVVLPRGTDSGESDGSNEAAQSAAFARSPDEVITIIENSGLRGRGGAEFPTGRKWRFAAETKAERRYIVCNADESEPLTFKDRVLIDTDPHAILAGMMIAGYAVGATEGIIYVRGEYEAQAQRLERAITEAEAGGSLGENLLGSGFDFHVHVHRGAGAYICGEETALLESLEGKRGEPRVRPPYPVTHGLHGCPTVVNNVETLARVTALLRPSPFSYVDTRLHGLQGHITTPGLIEVTPGYTLRELIDRFGDGMHGESEFQFALTGGAAGSFIGPEQLDVPLDDRAAKQQVALGSGGILVCDHSVTPPQVLREVLHFFERESCGKCTPCRIGTAEAREILDRLLTGCATRDDLNRLHELAAIVKRLSLCGLGTSAAEPIETAITRFRHSFEALLP